MIEHLDEFIKCLEEHRYFDAHEALEEVWFDRRFEDDDEIKLLKGFINASVSFELRKRGREEASKRVWKNYLKYKPLLHKVDSPFSSKYHFIAKYLDDLESVV
jgi:hypothetical protein